MQRIARAWPKKYFIKIFSIFKKRKKGEYIDKRRDFC